jgi:hypothetical protein
MFVWFASHSFLLLLTRPAAPNPGSPHNGTPGLSVRALESTSASDVTGTLGWVLGELVRVGQVGLLNRSLLEDEHDGGSAGRRR